MGSKTGIEWADVTWNPWQGCTPVSEGCDHCYMFREKRRYGQDPKTVIRSVDRTFRMPMSRKRVPAGSFVFVCSWSDFFHPDVPDDWRHQALGMMAFRHDVTFLLLTKRPEKMAEYLGDFPTAEIGGALACEFDRRPTEERRSELEPAVSWLHGEWCERDDPQPPWSEMNHACVGLPNVWLGVTAENQARADERIPQLLSIDWPGKKFVSLEPLLGPIDLNGTPIGQALGPCDQCGSTNANAKCEACMGIPSLDWAIVGAESGPDARPTHPDWVRALRDDCTDAGVPFLFKSWGEWAPIDKPWDQGSPLPCARNERFMNVAGGHGFHGKSVWRMRRVGKTRSGRELDGREWLERP